MNDSIPVASSASVGARNESRHDRRAEHVEGGNVRVVVSSRAVGARHAV